MFHGYPNQLKDFSEDDCVLQNFCQFNYKYKFKNSSERCRETWQIGNNYKITIKKIIYSLQFFCNKL